MKEIDLLLLQFDRAYGSRSWHGAGLRGALRGISAATALKRPRKNRRNINEQVLHAAYWKYAVWRRLTGAELGTFPLEGSNWFERHGPASDKRWRSDLRILASIHAKLRRAIAAAPPARLHLRMKGSPLKPIDVILGVAAHDLYHAGQIQLIKRIVGARDG